MFEISGKDLHDVFFTDSPVPCSRKDYIKTRDTYVKTVMQVPAVKAIYQMGSITTPGISDLDLIVVLDDDAASTHKTHYSTRRLTKKEQYIFMHPGAMVTNESTFRNLPLLIHASNLRRLLGEDLAQISLTSSEGRHVAYAVLIDHSIHLLHQLMKSVLSRVIPTRRTLMSLSSIKHSLALVKEADLEVLDTWRTFQAEIEELKRNWLTREDRQRLVHLLGKGISILLEILLHIEHALTRHHLIQVKNGVPRHMKAIFHSHSSVTFFANRVADMYRSEARLIGKSNFHIKMGQRHFNLTLSVLPLPLVFYCHFLSYTKGSTWLSRSLSRLFQDNGRGINKSVHVDKSYQLLMTRRVDLWGKNIEFLSKNKLADFDVMPFWGAHRVHAPRKTLFDITTQVLPFHLILYYHKRLFEKHIANSLHEKTVDWDNPPK